MLALPCFDTAGDKGLLSPSASLIWILRRSIHGNDLLKYRDAHPVSRTQADTIPSSPATVIKNPTRGTLSGGGEQIFKITADC